MPTFLHLRFSSDSDFCLLVANPFGISRSQRENIMCTYFRLKQEKGKIIFWISILRCVMVLRIVRIETASVWRQALEYLYFMMWIHGLN